MKQKKFHSIFRGVLAHSRIERVSTVPRARGPRKMEKEERGEEERERERERERNEGGTKRVKVRAVSNSRLEGPAWRSGRGPGGPRLARRDRAPKKANHLSSKVALPSGSCVVTRGGGGIAHEIRGGPQMFAK